MITLESRIKKIEERNKRVELDKAWETSTERKVLISLLTYFVVVSYFIYGGVEKPFLNAVVPTMGFLLSTITFNFFKKWWIKKRLS